MKRLGLLAIPLMAVSLLASCGGSKEPTRVSYTLTYTYDNGSTDKYVETYAEDKKTEKPTWVPEYSGYTFEGWFTKSGEEGTQFTFGNVLSTNTVIYAHWSENPAPAISHKLVYNFDNGTSKTYTETYVGDDKTEKPTWEPHYDEHTFKGWYYNEQGKGDDQVFTFGDPLTLEETNIHAHWNEVISTTYKVTFNFQDGKKGDGAVDSVNNIAGGTPFYSIIDDFETKQIAIPSDPAHFDFIGWGLSEHTPDKIKNDFKIADNLMVYAIYTPKATAKVTFDGTSTYCKLYLEDGTECVMGHPVIIPAGIDVKLTIKPNDGYLPIFKDNLTVTNATSHSFVPSKKEITINVANDVNCSIKATTTEAKDELNDYSWSEIRAISEGGFAPLVFKIGDEKLVNVNSKLHRVRIIGFNHDKDSEGNDLGITFEFADVITNSSDIAVTRIWNDEQSTNYDYRASTLNNFLNNDVLNMLPTDPVNKDLREVIKPVDKKVGVSTDEGQNYIATSFDGDTYPYPYLFPLAHDEMTNNEPYVTEGEGSKYQYYIDHPKEEDRIKRKAGGTAVYDTECYWLRSPRTTYSNFAWYVDVGGHLANDADVCNMAFAVAPAFCI